jgi:hypothetical protein
MAAGVKSRRVPDCKQIDSRGETVFPASDRESGLNSRNCLWTSSFGGEAAGVVVRLCLRLAVNRNTNA